MEKASVDPHLWDTLVDGNAKTETRDALQVPRKKNALNTVLLFSSIYVATF